MEAGKAPGSGMKSLFKMDPPPIMLGVALLRFHLGFDAQQSSASFYDFLKIVLWWIPASAVIF